MVKLFDALILWWALTWRWCFVFATFMGLVLLTDQSFVTNPASIGPLMVFLLIFVMLWSAGGIGQHAINHSFGRREITLTVGSEQRDKATWVDGLTLQWAIGWRTAVIGLIMTLIFIILDIKHETAVVDGSMVVTYGYGLQPILNIALGILSSMHLLKKVFGSRVYSINSKS